MTIERKHKGAYSELMATAWLLKNGYEVFRNVSQHGLVDIIGIKDGQIHLFDVKSIPENGVATPRLTQAQIDFGVKLMAVHADGRSMVIEETPKVIGGYAKRECPHCGRIFKPTTDRAKFCSSPCRTNHFNAAQKAAFAPPLPLTDEGFL